MQSGPCGRANAAAPGGWKALIITRDGSLDGRKGGGAPRRRGGRHPFHGRDGLGGGREPAINAPWPALVLALTLVSLYAVQALVPDQRAVADVLGFMPARLSEGVQAVGGWSGLVTALFVHGGWAHVLLNALGALAFGAPVARLLGLKAAGVAAFFGFFLACGIAGSLGYAALHMRSTDVLVGASGAVSGLMGAASRMIERRSGLAPFTSPTVLGMAAAWVIVNALTAVFGFSVGAQAGQVVAWEAHLFGYAAGLLLVWPLARVLRRI